MERSKSEPELLDMLKRWRELESFLQSPTYYIVSDGQLEANFTPEEAAKIRARPDVIVQNEIPRV